jgi:hypothetical protein
MGQGALETQDMYENSENLVDIIHLGDPDLEEMIMVQWIINK